MQSRYYNAEWGRFINADSSGGEVGTLISHNVFEYCMNNPVNMADPSGNFACWIVGAAVGAIAGAAYSYYTTGSVNWKYVIGGALVGAGLGYLAETAFTAVTTVVTIGATVANKLPNYQKAVVNIKKLTNYALNLEHPVGGDKARVFKSALGYTKSNAVQLRTTVIKQLPKFEAVSGKLDQYGQRYTVDMLIKGPNSNSAMVRTGWIIKAGEDAPNMVTIFVK